MPGTLDQIDQLDASMRIVVLHGREPFLMTQATHVLAERLAEAHGDVARFALDGETAELADVLDELRSGALFEPHKLVIVDAADKFIKYLTRMYNRARQTQITNEIAELMGGVEALK